MRKNYPRSSWQKVAPWYNKITEQGKGHYYHQHVIIPKVLNLLGSNSKLLDLACGNGVLGKALPKNTEYTGVDLAPALINDAKKQDRNPKHRYILADARKPLPISGNFDAAAIILALQNISNPEKVIKNASQYLSKGSAFVIVLNHPSFRIPRQTSWGIDTNRKIQYRRVDKYMSPMDIPINMNPGDKGGPVTMSYHFPLSAYSRMLKDAGFVIDLLEEWTSDKESFGRAAKMENRGRAEIPLFMAIRAIKI